LPQLHLIAEGPPEFRRQIKPDPDLLENQFTVQQIDGFANNFVELERGQFEVAFLIQSAESLDYRSRPAAIGLNVFEGIQRGGTSVSFPASQVSAAWALHNAAPRGCVISCAMEAANWPAR